MAWWIVLLLAGTTVVVAATSTLISGSSARTQAAAVEQKYFAPISAITGLTQDPATTTSEPVGAPISAITGSRQDPATKVSEPVENSVSTSKPRSTQRSAPSVAAVVSPSVPTSIELAGSPDPIRIVPIGVSAAGVLEPPADISTAGWWVSGPRPGMPGRAVITGHIDSAVAGLGAFAALDLLHPGDTITLTEADGRTLHFKVTVRQEVEKKQLDPRVLQRSTNISDLLLVTCIGDFNYSTRSYESNLLITAVPVSQ